MKLKSWKLRGQFHFQGGRTSGLRPRRPIMSKKQKTDPLTGGTGDVNKQFLYFDHIIPSGTPSAITQHVAITMPISPFTPSTPDGLVPVAEILSVGAMLENRGTMRQQIAGSSDFGYAYCLTQQPLNLISGSTLGHLFNTPTQDTFCYVKGLSNQAVISTTPETTEVLGPGSVADGQHASSTVDCTDAAGHGIIMYGNQLTSNFVFLAVAALVTQKTITWCVCWRLKYVTLAEFVANNNFSAARGTTL